MGQYRVWSSAVVCFILHGSVPKSTHCKVFSLIPLWCNGNMINLHLPSEIEKKYWPSFSHCPGVDQSMKGWSVSKKSFMRSWRQFWCHFLLRVFKASIRCCFERRGFKFFIDLKKKNDPDPKPYIHPIDSHGISRAGGRNAYTRGQEESNQGP